MSDISKLLIELGLQDDASPGLKKAGEQVNLLRAQLNEIGKIASGVALGSLGAQLGMSIAQHFKSALTEVEDFGNQVYQLQQRIGTSAQSTSGLLSVFERFGVPAEEANRILDFFSRGLRNQIDLAQGGAQANGAFANTLGELGVSAVDAEGHFRPVDAVLTDVIDRMHTLNNVNGQGARAINLFGRAGADIAPILNLSKEQFQELQVEAQRLGVVLTQQNVNDIRQLAMAHHDLDEATRGLSLQLGMAFVPALKEAAQGVAELVADLNKDNGAGVKQLQKDIKGLTVDIRELFGVFHTGDQGGDIAKVDALLNQIKGSGADVGKSLPGGHGLLGMLLGPDLIDHPEKALAVITAIRNAQGSPAAAAKSIPNNLDFSASIGRPPSADLNIPDDFGARIAAQSDGAARAARERLSNEEKLTQLGITETAIGRQLEILQQQATVLGRENLDMVDAKAAAELALLPIKQQQADLELELLEASKQRAQIDRDSALQRAQLSSMPASAALEDNQYQQQLLQAQMRAGILSGQGIPAGAISDLIKLKFAQPGLEVDALQAGHQVTLAQRAQEAGGHTQQLDTADIRKAQADLAIDSARGQRGVDAVGAELNREALDKVPEQSAIEAQRRALTDRNFDVGQQRNQLSGKNQFGDVTVNLTVNEAGLGGGPDYDKLRDDLAAVVMGALSRAAGRAESPAPATSPGAAY